MDESRALQHAAWAGAGSVVLLTVAVALGYLVGVDDPGVSDSAILERLDDAWVLGATYWPDPDIAIKADYSVVRNRSGFIQAPNSFNLGLGWWF